MSVRVRIRRVDVLSWRLNHKMKMTKTGDMEKRLSRRASMSRKLRVRPSDPHVEHFEELLSSTNVSEHGVYFLTNRSDYYTGMRLFVTVPFTFAEDPTMSEYVAEVVRVDKTADERIGIAVRLLMTI
jgi:hypothetical protein